MAAGYTSATWSLKLDKKTDWEKRGLKKTLGIEWKLQVTGIKRHSIELHYIYSSPDIIKINKSGIMT